jgi:hypothetical protein
VPQEVSSMPLWTPPLCDRHCCAMALKDLIFESAGEQHALSTYVCASEGCWRCYSEGSGYFDFVGGKPRTANHQRLCTIDKRPLYLEAVGSDNGQIWRCPECAMQHNDIGREQSSTFA